jgi:hypothetical protein
LKTAITHFSKLERNDAGYALITVLVIGLAAAMSLLAVAELAINSFRSEAQRHYAIELRNAAEAGADYAIGQLNASAAAHQACFLDDGLPHNFPSSYLSASGGSPVISNAATLGNMTVTMTVAKLPSTLWADIAGWSSVYSPSTDFTKSVSTTWKSPATTNILVDSWRVLTVKAQYSLAARYVRIVLQPCYDPPPLGTPSPGNQSYFSNVLLGNQGLNFAPPARLVVQAVTGPSNATVTPAANAATATQLLAVNQVFQYPLTLTTNEFTSIGLNTDILGNVQVASVNSLQNATAIMNGGLIEGTLTGNSSLPNVAPTVSANQDNSAIAIGNNVVSDADLYNTGTAGNPGTNPNGNPSNVLPTNRVGANQTPAVNSAGLSQALAAPPLNVAGASLPDFSATNNKLPTGDYTVTGLDTSNAAQFPSAVVAGAASGSTPVRLFVQDSSASSTALNISSNMLSNASTDASNFQIWYSGSNNININLVPGASFYGTIYAPNATVTTTGNGQFYGAIVAGTANIQHQGGLNLRVDLSAPSSAGPGLLFSSDSTSGAYLTGYKPVTWEEPQL